MCNKNYKSLNAIIASKSYINFKLFKIFFLNILKKCWLTNFKKHV